MSRKEASATEIAHRETVRELVEARHRVNTLLYLYSGTKSDDHEARRDLQAAILSYYRPVRMIARTAPTNGDTPDRWSAPLKRFPVHPEAAGAVPAKPVAELQNGAASAPFAFLGVDNEGHAWLRPMGLNSLSYFPEWEYTRQVEKRTVRGHYMDKEERRVVMPFMLAAEFADALDDETMDLGLGIEIDQGDHGRTDPL